MTNLGKHIHINSQCHWKKVVKLSSSSLSGCDIAWNMSHCCNNVCLPWCWFCTSFLTFFFKLQCIVNNKWKSLSLIIWYFCTILLAINYGVSVCQAFYSQEFATGNVSYLAASCVDTHCIYFNVLKMNQC